MTHKSAGRGLVVAAASTMVASAMAAGPTEAAVVTRPAVVAGSAEAAVVTRSAVIAEPTMVIWTATAPPRPPMRVGMGVRPTSPPVFVATSRVPVVTPTRVPKVTWTPLRERAYLSLSLRSDTQTG
jgi:hypothetical protein